MSKKETASALIKPVVITELPSQRAGLTFHFSGQEEDSNGDPLSQWVDIDLVIPPLNMDSMQLLEKPLAGLDGMSPAEALATLVKAITHALRRNYRGVPEWLIRQSLDVGNMTEISVALMDISGMARKAADEKKAKAAAGP